MPGKGTPEYNKMVKDAIEAMAALKGDREHFEGWAAETVEIFPEDLKHRCEVIKLSGLGICARCHWSSGCSSCDWPKAVRYFFNKLVKGMDVPSVHGQR